MVNCLHHCTISFLRNKLCRAHIFDVFGGFQHAAWFYSIWTRAPTQDGYNFWHFERNACYFTLLLQMVHASCDHEVVGLALGHRLFGNGTDVVLGALQNEGTLWEWEEVVEFADPTFKFLLTKVRSALGIRITEHHCEFGRNFSCIVIGGHYIALICLFFFYEAAVAARTDSIADILKGMACMALRARIILDSYYLRLLFCLYFV